MTLVSGASVILTSAYKVGSVLVGVYFFGVIDIRSMGLSNGFNSRFWPRSWQHSFQCPLLLSNFLCWIWALALLPVSVVVSDYSWSAALVICLWVWRLLLGNVSVVGWDLRWPDSTSWKPWIIICGFVSVLYRKY